MNSCAKGEDGTLYFGGENGLNFFKPEQINFEKEQYFIHINRLDILNERISVGSEFRDRVILKGDLEKATQIELSYKDKFIELGFVAVDFEHPEKVEYYHMLDGFDIDWVKSPEGNHATYTKLPPGSYTFRVKARTIHNSWTEDIISSLPAPFSIQSMRGETEGSAIPLSTATMFSIFLQVTKRKLAKKHILPLI